MARYELDSEKSDEQDKGNQIKNSGLYSKVNSKLKRESVKSQLQKKEQYREPKTESLGSSGTL